MPLAGVLDLDEHRTFDNAGLLPNFYALHCTPNYSSSLRYHTFDLIHANRRDKNRVFATSAHIATALPPTLEVNTTTGAIVHLTAASTVFNFKPNQKP